MPISSLAIQNFKGIRDPVRVNFRPITLLFGPNSAGKSTVLQALLYAREILERRNTDPDTTTQGGPFVNFGGFRNFVYDHDSRLPVVLEFGLDLRSTDLTDYYDLPTTAIAQKVDGLQGVRREPLIAGLSREIQHATIRLEVKWSEIIDDPVQSDYTVALNGLPAVKGTTDTSSGVRHTVSVNRSHPLFSSEDETAVTDAAVGRASPVRDEGKTSWDELPVSDVGQARPTSWKIETLLDEIRHVLNAMQLGDEADAISFALLAPGRYLLTQLKALRYLGPIRETPLRGFVPTLSPDSSRWASGLAAWDWIYSARDEEIAALNDWLIQKARLNTGYRVDRKRYKELNVDGLAMVALRSTSDIVDTYDAIRKDIDDLPTKTRVVLRKEEGFLEVMPQDVGIGISQLIPVVVAGLDQHEGIAVIEQPELHIHPAVQVALGDLFIKQTESTGAIRKQFLIESHSEHLLLRFLRRIRETTEDSGAPGLSLTADRLAVYFVEANADGTSIRELVLDEKGNFVGGWPKGFFDEREREFFGDTQPMSDEDLKRFLGK